MQSMARCHCFVLEDIFFAERYSHSPFSFLPLFSFYFSTPALSLILLHRPQTGPSSVGQHLSQQIYFLLPPVRGSELPPSSSLHSSSRQGSKSAKPPLPFLGFSALRTKILYPLPPLPRAMRLHLGTSCNSLQRTSTSGQNWRPSRLRSLAPSWRAPRKY